MHALVVCYLLICTVCATHQTLVFSDDFNDFDLSIWKHEITMSGGGNWEFEMYMNNRSSSYASGGSLYIKPFLTSEVIGVANVQSGYTWDAWGGEPASLCTGNNFYGCLRTSGGGGNVLNPVISAKVRTAESFNFRYGTVEIRAKMPRGDWLWPALWMMPTDNQYGEWPASGEIDILESRGNVNYPRDQGPAAFGSTLHWGPMWDENGYTKTHKSYTVPSGDLSDDYHVYGLVWNETVMFTYIDSPANQVLVVKMDQTFWQRGGWGGRFANPWVNRGNNAPFDRKFYLILEVAVGGINGYFPDGVGGKPWTDSSPHAINDFFNSRGTWYPTWSERGFMAVDWVKVWQ